VDKVGNQEILPQDSKGNFILYVSNQSFAINPVDIAILIDGKLAVSDHFEVKDQHNWIQYQFLLNNGEHTIEITSKKGKAALKQTFEIKGKHWACVDYWYYPHDKDHNKIFTFDIQDVPMGFA